MNLAVAFDEAYARRASINAIANQECFDKQLAYLRDHAYLKAILASRRAGKTNVFAVELVQDALRYAGRKQIYLGLTKESAEGAIWRDVMLPLFTRRGMRSGVDYTYGSVAKLVEFPNGSTIRFAGIDASPQDMKRLLGGKIHRAILDECQDYTQDVRQLVFETLEPAVADYSDTGGGFIEMGGTPGHLKGDHLWWRVTAHDDAGEPSPHREAGWNVHEWNVHDNPHMRAVAERVRASFETKNPHYMDDPVYRRAWLGKWVTEAGTLVYKYDAKRNTLADDAIQRELLTPQIVGPGQRGKWTFVIGVDVGWDDGCAWVVCAYHHGSPKLYVVESSKLKLTVFSEIGQLLQKLAAKYGVSRVIVDQGGGGSKWIAQSLQREFSLPIFAAEKTEKEGAIARLNSDLLGGQLLVIGHTNAELVKEWSELQVDRRARDRGEFKEAEKWQNHLADACLYAHRDSLHMFGKEPAPAAARDDVDEMVDRLKRTRPAVSRRDRDRDLLDRLDDRREINELASRYREARAR